MNLKRVISTKNLSRSEWLEERKKGIGGSDAGAILGFNSYKGAFAVYMDKITDMQEDLSDVETVYWGNVLEDIVANEFEKRTGKKVEKVNAILRHDDNDFMIANIDRRIVGENAILECKTTNQFLEKNWDGDEVPAAYICQCMHYMAVTGAEKCYIACLIGGQRFVYKQILRDDEFIGFLIDKERDFWQDNVLKGIPPEADGNSSTKNYINKAYPQGDGCGILLTTDIEKMCQKRIRLRTEVCEMKKEIEEIDNKIKRYMGSSTYAISDKFRVSWTNVPGRKILDTDKLAADYAISDIENYYKQGNTSRRFNVKEYTED